MLRPRDDFVLQRLAQIAEVVAVACHAHDQIAVLFGVFLCGAERLHINHVKLDVMPVEFEVGADELHQPVEAGFVVQQTAA